MLDSPPLHVAVVRAFQVKRDASKALSEFRRTHEHVSADLSLLSYFLLCMGMEARKYWREGNWEAGKKGRGFFALACALQPHGCTPIVFCTPPEPAPPRPWSSQHRCCLCKQCPPISLLQNHKHPNLPARMHTHAHTCTHALARAVATLHPLPLLDPCPPSPLYPSLPRTPLKS